MNSKTLLPPGQFRHLALLLVLVLFSCSSGLQVRSDQDLDVDFSSYQTYGFFDELGIEGGYNSPVFGEHFRIAISQEMRQLGFRKSSNPDVLINVTIRGDDQVRLRTFSQPYMSGHYYDRPGGAHYGTGVGVGVGVGTRATKVTEASVFIDMVDPRANRVKWQGVAVFDVKEKVATRLRDSVYTVVEAIMAQYPASQN